MEPSSGPRIRPAREADAPFILSLVPRFVAFELPPWRERDESAAGVRRDIERHLRERPDTSHFFIAETAVGVAAGFMHLQATIDFFTGAANCHVSDLVVAEGMDGQGIGRGMLAFAEHWAKQCDCRYLTLGVFPGNARAIELYERNGFGVELLRMAKPLARTVFQP
jgi:ribosomal protein S18 acetylase RimI-like enzyme